jgi:hypothetical protein
MMKSLHKYLCMLFTWPIFEATEIRDNGVEQHCSLPDYSLPNAEARCNPGDIRDIMDSLKRPPLSELAEDISSFSSSMSRFPSKGQRLILVPRGSPTAILLEDDVAYRLSQRQHIHNSHEENELKKETLSWDQRNLIQEIQELTIPPDRNQSLRRDSLEISELEMIPLVLKSHPGQAIVTLQTSALDGGFMLEQSDYVELGIGPENNAVKIRLQDTSTTSRLMFYSSSDLLSRYSLVCEDGSLLIVSSPELFHGSPITMTSWLLSSGDEAPDSDMPELQYFTDWEGQGSFIVHQDGSLSPLQAQHLVIGVTPYPAVTLVERYSFHRLLFKNAADFWKAPAPINGTPLVLKSHPGLVVTASPSYTGAFTIAEVQDLVVAPIGEVEILNFTSIDFRKHHEFRLRTINMMELMPMNLQLDVNVPLRLMKYNVSQGKLVNTLLSTLLHYTGNATWIINSEGSISPLKAPHLALGCQYIPGYLDPHLAAQQRLFWGPADRSQVAVAEGELSLLHLRTLHQLLIVLFLSGLYKHIMFTAALVVLFLIRLVSWLIWVTVLVRLCFGMTTSAFFFGIYIGVIFTRATFRYIKKSK